jgi:bisphosphoglycerate-dependent phosphoglycerate mutase
MYKTIDAKQRKVKRNEESKIIANGDNSSEKEDKMGNGEQFHKEKLNFKAAKPTENNKKNQRKSYRCSGSEESFSFSHSVNSDSANEQMNVKDEKMKNGERLDGDSVKETSVEFYEYFPASVMKELHHKSVCSLHSHSKFSGKKLKG